MIEQLKETLSGFVEIEEELVTMTFEQSKDIKEFVTTIIENIHNPIKSPTMATNYLRRYDPTFTTAIKLTLSQGYKATELNSELMATIHNKARLNKLFIAKFKHLNKEFLATKTGVK